MMDNSNTTTIFPCPPNDGFPTGLRVLVVDDDLTWLKILEKMLKKCLYEVTTCCLARDALNILRDRKDGFDIVISDVNMPDMDGFKLLELLGLEMDLPVIMMSVDGETSRVMKGVQHGACDYLLKPIRMKELRNIWQHVLRKRINDVQSFDEVVRMMRIGTESSVSDHPGYGNDSSVTRKRKEVADKNQICSTELIISDHTNSKRARVVWTVDLHQKFVQAVKLIGIEKIGPKKILDSMNVPWLTRENVASHLQKYRLYLSRLQKENGDKPFEVSNHILDVDFCKLRNSDHLLTNDYPEEISLKTRKSDKHIDEDKRASTSNILHYECDTNEEAKVLVARRSDLVQLDCQLAEPDFNNLRKYPWNEDISIEHYFDENVKEEHQRIDDYGFDHWHLRQRTSVRSENTLGNAYASCSQLQTRNYRFEVEDSELALVAFGKDYKFRWDGRQSDHGSDNFHGCDEALRFDWCGGGGGEAPRCPIMMMDQSLAIVDTAHFSSCYYPVR